MSFDSLGLSPKVKAAVDAAGYTEPTPIQAEAIPVAIEGRDVLGLAQTGTGKTASFVLPMLTRLERGRARARMPRSLILAPTRELAAQVAESFDTYGKEHRLTTALLIGGVSFDEQFKVIDRGADILIATPGRLLDHFGRGKLLLTGVEIFVIDEADRMLDMGFIPDIERIAKLLPPRRQTLFFSATMPPEIQRLVDTFLRDPVRVEVARASSTASTITQRFIFCSGDGKEKRKALRKVIEMQDEVQNAIVFCNRKRDVAILYKSLRKHGYNVGELHGDMDQYQRTETLEKFRNGEITFLAASDVAARGLDIPEVSHVFNYDVPVQAEDYVHRIGRTGRAGREGYSATLVTSDDQKVLKGIMGFDEGNLEWIGDTPSDDDFGSRKGRGRGGRSGRGGRGASKRDDKEERGEAKRGRSRGGRRKRGGRDRDDGAVELADAPQPDVSDAAEHADEGSPARRPDDDAKPRGRRSRGRGSDKPKDDSKRASGRERDSGGGSGKERGRSSKRRHDSQRDIPESDNRPGVKGLGDHVPEFLKR